MMMGRECIKLDMVLNVAFNRNDIEERCHELYCNDKLNRNPFIAHFDPYEGRELNCRATYKIVIWDTSKTCDNFNASKKQNHFILVLRYRNTNVSYTGYVMVLKC